MANLWPDARYALRLLAKAPGFTLTAVLSLALGIGATSAVFSVIHAVLISPYPYAGADRMVRVLAEDKTGTPRNFFLNGPQLQQVRQLHSVAAALGQANWEFSTTGNDLPEGVRAVLFTTNASSYFGVPPLLGRGLLPSDAPDGQNPQPVVVLSFSFWKRRFSGDLQILGKTLSMSHQEYTIVGVLPPRFAWTGADVYLPLRVTNDPNGLLWLSGVKLKPGVTPQAAQVEFQSLLQLFAKETPAHFPEDFRVHLQRLTDEHNLTFVHTLYLLFAAVGLMLWIGCANFAILLLARGSSRQQEFALRSALGASRARVIRQLLVESVLLSLSGAALGILVAHLAVTLIANWLPSTAYPHEVAIQINLPVLGFTVSLALIAGLFFGLAPALRLSSIQAHRGLLSGVRTVVGPRADHLHAVLVVVQVALTLLLLSTGGTVGEGFLRLIRAPLGYDPHNTLDVGIPLHDNTYMSWEKRSSYFDQLRQRIAAIPGVLSAAISTRATPPSSGLDMRVVIASGVGKRTTAAEEQRVRLSMVSSEYFSLLQIPVLAGRIWERAETMRAAPVAVINEKMARQYWPKGVALGQFVRFPDLKNQPFRLVPPAAAQSFQIIGVVADVRNDGLGQTVRPGVYLPYTFDLEVYTEVLVHTTGALAPVYRAVREQVRNVDADQQVEGNGEIFDLESELMRQEAWQRAHLAAILLGAFGLLALALASVGLYSIVSYGVAQRTGEFGIRIALGAQRRDVYRLVFSSAAASVAIGIAAGTLLSFYAAKMVAHWTEINASNAVVFLNATLLFLVAATIACLVPARVATAIDPIEALRSP